MATFIVPEIDADCNDNEAGVTSLDIINEDDLVTPLPAAVDSVIATDLSLVDSAIAGFVRWRFLRYETDLGETANDADNHDVSVKFQITKDNASKRNTFKQMYNPCCLYSLIVTDANGHVKLVTGMKFRWNYTTGKGGENNDKNVYDGEFYKSGKAAVTYTGAIPRKI